MTRRLNFRLLGPMEVLDGDRSLPLGGRKQRTLLAILLLHANEVVSSDALIDGIWGERVPKTAPTALQVSVSNLRKLLSADRVETRSPGYVLRVEPDELDLTCFERLCREARRLTPEAAAAALAEALAFWHGQPLADFAYESFAQSDITRLGELRLSALEQRIEAELELGRHADLIGELESLVAEHPLREGLRAQLILALYRSGRQAEALEAYRQARTMLVEELGIEPGAALKELEKSILAQDAALEAPVQAEPDSTSIAELPNGTVTMLFSDVEGSTKLLRVLGREQYVEALDAYRALTRQACVAQSGVEVEMQGDCFHFAFPGARVAIEAAAAAQRALAAHRWPGDQPLRVRIGLHTGEPASHGQLFAGLDLHRAARVMSVAHGGQVVLSQATRDLLAGELELRDLGLHRLKDLAEPERLYQLGEEEFPPLRSLNATNLPVQPSPLVGRERELAEVVELLAKARLVTLTGAGGTGKTRLALQAATDVVDEYPEGVWWVPLAALRDPELVEPTIAHALGAKDGLADLRGKRTLLLLDNFEQLVDAAPRLSELLAEAEQLTLVVTSREPLHLSGEHEYPVPPLPEEDAVTLFKERARAVHPGFQPDEYAAEICRRLEGLPLAIELAAARVKVLAPAALLERLEHPLPVLTGGARDAPERQRTLAATITWSHELLSERERTLFRRLAVFAGGFTLEAAEEICAADLDSLHSLVDKSLVRRRGDRFAMLETIREYAFERLEASGELDRIRRRHFDFFLTLAEEASEDLERDQRTAIWLARLELEHDNCRAALQWARDLGEPRLELRLVTALSRFWDMRSHWDEGRSRVAEALARNQQAPADLRGHALGRAAMMAHKQGDPDAARALAEEATAGYRATGDTRGLAHALSILGGVAAGERKHREARALKEESKSMYEELGDEYGLQLLLHNLGLLALDEGQHDEARRQLEASLALARKNGLERDLANNLCDLGFVAIGQSRHDEAQELLEEALRLGVELGWKENVDYCLIGLAGVSAAAGELERAARLLGAAEALGEEIQFRLEPYAESTRAGTARDLDSRLGRDRFAACLAEGRSLSFGEAMSLALANMH